MTKFISSDKLKYHPRNVAEFLETGFSSPICAQFQITNRCRFKCMYCDKTLNDKESTVPDIFIQRLKELGIKSVILTGGEPTLYSKFDIDIPRLQEHFRLGIVTTLCNYQPLLESHFDWIKVSLDTVNEATFKEIRGGTGLKQILRNLDRLYSKATVPVGTQIVLTEKNQSAVMLLDFIDRVKDICDYIQIRPIESPEPYHYDEKVYRILEALRENPKVSISDKFYHSQKPTSCPSRWAQLLINVDHDVMLCCNRDKEKVANLYDPHFLEKSKAHQFGYGGCFHSCVLSGNNAYLNSLLSGTHKEFV